MESSNIITTITTIINYPNILEVIKINSLIRYELGQIIEKDYNSINNLTEEELEMIFQKYQDDCLYYDKFICLGEIISSKGIDRLKSLERMLNGFNWITNSTLDWYISINNKYFIILICIYIIVAQVFSDCNHRTSLQLLQSNGFDTEQSNQIIEKIKKLNYLIISDFNCNFNGDFLQTIRLGNIIRYYNYKYYIEQLSNIYLEYFIEYI